MKTFLVFQLFSPPKPRVVRIAQYIGLQQSGIGRVTKVRLWERLGNNRAKIESKLHREEAVFITPRGTELAHSSHD
jgi:hypothetical protein